MCHVSFEKYVTVIQDISKMEGICEMSEWRLISTEINAQKYT